MRKFEFVELYKNDGLDLPQRGTAGSAGYDIAAAEDVVVPSIWKQFGSWLQENEFESEPLTLEDHKAENKLKATMIPTGLKMYCEDGEWIQIVPRSSIGGKHSLSIPMGFGTVDQDYVDNPDNEGHVYVPLINFSQADVLIKKGTRIAQAIFRTYQTVDNDTASKTRSSGFGSTGK